MAETVPFAPDWESGTQTLAATTSSGTRVAVPTRNGTIRLFNAGTTTVFIKAGGATVAATTSDLPIPPGVIEVISKGGATHISGITNSDSATVYVTPGEGV
jgi:hypothetical protein